MLLGRVCDCYRIIQLQSGIQGKQQQRHLSWLVTGSWRSLQVLQVIEEVSQVVPCHSSLQRTSKDCAKVNKMPFNKESRLTSNHGKHLQNDEKKCVWRAQYTPSFFAFFIYAVFIHSKIEFLRINFEKKCLLIQFWLGTPQIKIYGI